MLFILVGTMTEASGKAGSVRTFAIEFVKSPGTILKEMVEQNEAVTKSMFTAGVDHLARLVNAGFLEMEKRMSGY